LIWVGRAKAGRWARRPNDQTFGKSWRTFHGTTCPTAGGVATRFREAAVIDSIHKPDDRILCAFKPHVVLQNMI
jgi:hypothetical protein